MSGPCGATSGSRCSQVCTCSRRVSGGKVRFDPAASLRHLQAARGGTRAYGIPLCSASPAHSVGEYYLACREGRGWERVSFILWRMFRSVRTRFHLARPWRIPVKLFDAIRDYLHPFGYRLFGIYDQQPEWSGEHRIRFTKVCFALQPTGPVEGDHAI